LNELSLAQKGRLRHRLVEPALAAFAGLMMITVAHAALPPNLDQILRKPAAPAPALPALKPAVAAEPAVLIAFVEPVTGYAINSPFGLRRLPWEDHGRLHEGVDVAAPVGEPVRATADGVVTRAGYSPSYGRYVEVMHAEGLTSFYAHMGAIQPGIASGVAVKGGTPVGAIGDTGTSTGPHLHFEVRDADDRPLNPTAFIGRAFAKAEDLPLRQAARVPRHVRLAFVSHIPASKRELMAEKQEAKSGKAAKGLAGEDPMIEKVAGRERVRAQIRMIAQAQHREDAQKAASAADAGSNASASAPLPPAVVDLFKADALDAGDRAS
jgi:hypothetical protein